ncbi:MAG: cofactor-independent phosphoglycerate mutase [Clostridiales bacterium]|nr:cofactor-independent phosphoglycerate mutase [Clostridiales bacterium]
MKYAIILGDGMADEPLEELQGKTPMEYASTPVMDELASMSELGLLHTIPDGMKPGSDTANLSVLGYDPAIYYSGRSPLEALSIGVPMKDTDIALRANIVTLSDDDVPYEEKTILDHSSGEISTEDAAVLVEAVKKELQNEMFQYYVGTSYRHLLIWDKGEVVDLVQPHDILGQVIGDKLPQNPMLREMMKRSHEILNHHPLNEARRAAGLNPANSLWFWGAGTTPKLSSFQEKTQKKGAMISAVDLLKGIAVGAQMTNISVEGANGTLETNYEGKAEAAVKALLEDGFDFVYLHLEAPDEMGHQGSIERKIKSIENLDQRILKIVKTKMDASGEDYRLLVLPDHPTPICVRTHTSTPVPYILYDSTAPRRENWKYNEREARQTGVYMAEGHKMIDHLFER